MVNQVTLEDYHHPNRLNNQIEPINGYNQVSLINSSFNNYDTTSSQQIVDQPTTNQTAAYSNNATYSTTPYYSGYYYYPTYETGNNQQPQYNDQYHNQLIRRNSLNNYDQSTDSEQYLINSYYELSDNLEQPTNQPTYNTDHLQEQNQFIENYHHLNHSSQNQSIANNPNYIYENYYTADYLANRENALNFNSMILFDSSLFKRIREHIKQLCSKPCMLLVFIPIFFATILILVFIRQIYKTDKTDKDDLHQYAIYAFIIFSVLFISPFALFFSIVLVNKIIKKYNKCFNPNFISNEFGDLINAQSIDPNLLIVNNQLASTSNANNTANHTSHHSSNLIHDHQSPILTNSNQIDLQTNTFASQSGLQINPNNSNLQDNQQISTLNVNQLQYSNNRQLINEMIEEFDQMSEGEQERTLQRMSSIQRRQRLIRQNAFECSPESVNDLNLFFYEDKPPSYELALLCPKKKNCEKKLKETTDKKTIKKLNSNYVNLNIGSDANNVNNYVTDNDLNNTGNNISNNTANNTGNNISNINHNLTPIINTDDTIMINESNNTLQTELRNNLENRRRSSNGSSINTEPPTYSSLFTANFDTQKEDSKPTQ